MTDEEIVEIRDSVLPSQGESFDCIAFARALLKARWINVRDRLPLTDEPVLILYRADSGSRSKLIARYAGGAWRFLIQRQRNRLAERITHWMELPEEP